MYCSRCGAQLVPDSTFCAKCGAAVAQPPASSPAPAGAPAPPPFRPGPPSVFATPSPSTTPLVIKRPGIVTFLAVLHFIGAAFWLLVGLGSFGATLAPSEADASGVLVMAPVFIAIGAAHLFCGIGLLKLKPYGRTLQLVFAWIGLIALPLGTIISILILIYFFKPGIKLIFAGRPGDDFTDQEVAEIRNDTASSGATTVIVVVVSVILGIAIIGIIAAIAVPGLLRARMAGNESTAITSLRAIVSAEQTYAASCASGGFAVALEDLAKPASSGGSGFIGGSLRENGLEQNGYVIALTRDESPIVTDVGTAAATCNGSRYQPASSYFASAEPVNTGATGARYFAVDGRGVIYQSYRPISNPIMDSTDVVPVR